MEMHGKVYESCMATNYGIGHLAKRFWEMFLYITSVMTSNMMLPQLIDMYVLQPNILSCVSYLKPDKMFSANQSEGLKLNPTANMLQHVTTLGWLTGGFLLCGMADSLSISVTCF